eukprot:gene671-8172_t
MTKTTSEQFETTLKSLKLKKVIKENHKQDIIKIEIHPKHQNLISTIGSNQINIYDNEHIGSHLDLISHFVNIKTNISKGSKFNSLSWVSEKYLAGSTQDGLIQILSIIDSRVIAVYPHDKVHQIVGFEEFLFSSSLNQIKVFNTKNHSLVQTIETQGCKSIFYENGSLFSGHSNGKLRIWNFNEKESKLEDESFIIYDSKLSIQSILKLNDILLLKNENEIIVGKLENGQFEEFKKIDDEIGNFDLKSFKNENEKNNYYLLVGNQRGNLSIYKFDENQNFELFHELNQEKSELPINDLWILMEMEIH